MLDVVNTCLSSKYNHSFFSMLVKTFGSAVYGVEAIAITIEVNVSNGQGYYIVGLPDNAIKESLQRVESAIKTNKYEMPRTKLVVNMAPADIKKTGSAFDLPIALGVLGATEQIDEPDRLKDYVIMGELSLDGSVQSIKGALPIAIQARREGFKGLIVPKANAREAGMVNNLAVYGVTHLQEVIILQQWGMAQLQARIFLQQWDLLQQQVEPLPRLWGKTIQQAALILLH